MSNCPGYIDCDNKNTSIEDILRLLVQTDSNGCQAIKVYNTCRDILSSSNANSGSTFANEDHGSNVDWADIANVASADGQMAEASLAVGEISKYLNVSNFGFNIPLNATIKGILLEIEKHEISTVIVDEEIKLRKAGVRVGDNKADTVTEWPSMPDQYISHGGSSDLWGTTWTAAQINDSGFGVSVAVENDGGDPGAGHIDHIKITVYYNPPNC